MMCPRLCAAVSVTSVVVLMINVIVVQDVSAQFVPVNPANWSIPFPTTLACSPPSSNQSAQLQQLGSLSWCKYDNPYILSDFLSRNSTDLTTTSESGGGGSNSQSGQSTFQLHIECDGIPVVNNEFIDPSNASSVYRTCRGISAIQAGSAGIIDQNGTVRSMTNYISFADLSGQLLFVYFNNNTMAQNLPVPVTNVNNADIMSVQYEATIKTSGGPFHNNYTETVIAQDMIVFVTNASMAAMMRVSGIDGSISYPCVIIQYPLSTVEQYGITLQGASFFPTRPNSTNDLVNLGWVSTANLSATSTPSYEWMKYVFYYEFNSAPATQALVVEYLDTCPQATPMDVQFYMQIYASSPMRLSVMHNRASNMSFLLVYSKHGVTFWHIGYSGPNRTIPALEGRNKTIYTRSVLGLSDWCENRTVFDPETNVTKVVGRQKNTVFCTPDKDTYIDDVEMVSPDLWTDIGPYNRDVWLIIALHNATNSFLYVMSLTELTYIPENESTFSNPLAVPDNNPCNFDSHVYYIDPSTGQWQCQRRVTATHVLPDATPASDVSAKVILGSRSTTTTGNDTANGPAAQMNGLAFQDHALVFVAQESSVEVFAMYSLVDNHPNNESFFIMEFQNYNSIRFLGNVSSLYVSDNGMHLFTSVSRHAWELASQTRYSEICAALEKDPTNPFLAPGFGSVCASVPPQDVNLNSFTQYASYCSFNVYCPSLDQMTVTMPPNRYFADRPAVSKICPPGYFCVAGQKVQCPQGFYCDEYGMDQPKRCPDPVNSNSTCAQPGLIRPLDCPDGTVCWLPHIPGLPAPPGYQVPTPPATRDEFLQCPDGFWCVLGAQAPIVNTSFTNSTFECPANTYCSEPSTMQPVPCECEPNSTAPGAPTFVVSANGTVLECDSRTLYCPTGSIDVSWCPAGYYCTMPNVSTPCAATQYCPPGTFAPQLCPAGFFCEVPSATELCPSGHYCPEGSTFPLQCNFLTVCPAGSAAQTRSLLVVAVIVGVVGGVFIGFFVFTRYERRKQEQDAAAHIVSKEVREYLSRSALEDDFDYLASKQASVNNRQTAQPGGATPIGSTSSKRAVEEEAAVGIDQEGDVSGRAGLPTDAENDENSLKVPIMGRSGAGALSIPTSRFQTPVIRFDGMGLRLEVGEAKGKVVLDNVTGVIPPGSFVAVMGPSGSGKSTFMHTLAGKAFYGTRMGHVYVNDDEVDLNRFSKIVGFVKQDDIMLREMTVSETLLFNARMRYDPLSIDSPEGIANAMLTALDLNHVRNTNIGDEKKRGVSGGQRKRVNIGMELVALPSILFLDEPTSGLDSSSSMSVCSALREMANVGVTVIAVIHQPRYEIFNMFHKVLLLAKGGKLVYYGAPQDALNYFERYIGIACPPHVNPPDFFMDVISGEVNEKGLSIDDMVLKWNEYRSSGSGTAGGTTLGAMAKEDGCESGAAGGKKKDETAAPPSPTGGYQSVMYLATGDGKESLVRGLELADQAGKKEIAGFFRQLFLFTARSFVQLSRDLVWFFTDLFLVFVAGFFLGLVFSESNYQPPLPQQIVNRSIAAFGSSPPPLLSEFFARPIDDPIISEASLTCMAIGMTGITAALRVFGNEQIVYWREASAGMSTSAYFFAKNISHVFFIVLSPLLYLAPYLTFVSARAGFFSYYRVLVLLQFTTTGLGYLVSIVVPGGLAQLAGVVVVLVFSMFGGSRPTLVEIQSMFILLQGMPYASYIRWAQEALYLEEITMWGQVVNIQPSLDLFDYHLDDYQLCMILTFVFGIVFRLMALLAMMLLHRDQKH